MKKLINAPQSVVREMLEGMTALYPGLARVAGQPVLVRADCAAVKGARVALVSGGGSGHEPAHGGYVGRGMLSAAVAGDVFTSPPPDAVVAALHAVAGPAGALLIVKNYTGDRLNFGLAAEMLRLEGVPVEIAVVADDVALAAAGEHAGRRGLAGTVLVHKVAGAAAEAGAPLAEVARVARDAAAAVRTMGVALSPCTVPAAGSAGFELGADEIELGLGIHGEPGVRRAPWMPADALVEELLGPILADLAPARSSRVVLLVNNLGGTPTMELAVVARRAIARLEEHGVAVVRAYAGTYLSALEMAGVSLSVMAVDDATLARLDAPTEAPAWTPARPRQPAPEITVPGPATRPPGPPSAAPQSRLAPYLTAVTRTLAENADHLTRLDAAVGDGDLGVSLLRGVRAIDGALPGLPADPSVALHELGLLLQRVMGGTSGPLYAVFLMRAARELGGEPGAAAWARAFAAGCRGIRELGGASAGDCTMLDALEPAADAVARALELPRRAGARSRGPGRRRGRAVARGAGAGARAVVTGRAKIRYFERNRHDPPQLEHRGPLRDPRPGRPADVAGRRDRRAHATHRGPRLRQEPGPPVGARAGR